MTTWTESPYADGELFHARSDHQATVWPSEFGGWWWDVRDGSEDALVTGYDSTQEEAQEHALHYLEEAQA
jgi:hypothetical protein